MEMPTVGPEIQRLTQLMGGTWRGDETLYPSDWDPKGGAALGTWVVQPSLDGFALIVDYTEERDGQVVYRGHGIHGWDAQDRTFLAYWFDNIGVLPKQPVRATLDGQRYTYQSDDGPAGHTRMTYEWVSELFSFRIDTSKDGVIWKPMHEGRYTRVA